MIGFINWLFRQSILHDCIAANNDPISKSFNKIEKTIMFILFYLITYTLAFISLTIIFSGIFAIEIELLGRNPFESASEDVLQWSNWEKIWKGGMIKGLVISIIMFIIFDIILPTIYFTKNLIIKLYEILKN